MSTTSSASKWIRQMHRWLAIAFTVTVIANFVALAQGGGMPPPWVTYSPLLPLALLLLTGLYLFVLPYATKWRSGRRTDCTRERRVPDAVGVSVKVTTVSRKGTLHA